MRERLSIVRIRVAAGLHRKARCSPAGERVQRKKILRKDPKATRVYAECMGLGPVHT